jgi:hypothetical protein
LWYNKDRGIPLKGGDTTMKIIKYPKYTICPVCEGEYLDTEIHPILHVCQECYLEDREMFDAIAAGEEEQKKYFQKEEEKEELLEEIKKEWREINSEF